MSGIMQSALGNWKVASAAASVALVYNLDAAALGALPSSSITTSASFNGSTQYLNIANTSALGLGTGDFTIEYWWRPTSSVRSDVVDLWGTGGGGDNNATRLIFGSSVTGSSLGIWVDSTPTGNVYNAISGPTLASLLNSWHHIALTRQSGAISMWVDGTQVGSTYSAATLDFGASQAMNIMGDHGGGGGNGSGNLSNLRVVVGTALYTATFTPPTTTLRAVSGTTFLLPLTAAPFMDLSANLLTVTNNGTTVTSVQAPALTTGTTDLTGTYAITSSTPTATFTGSITGTTLTVSGVTGTITTGMTVTGGSVPAGTYIVSGSGSTWTVSASVTQGSTSMTGARINWFGTQGGIFSNYFSGDAINAFITGGPNIPSSTPYTVMMAYKLNNGLTANYGRLLNSDTGTPDFIMGGYSNYPKVYFSNGVSINLTSATRDTVWHIDFVTFNGTSLGNVFSSTSVQPTATPTYTATNAGISGFNQLQLYSKSDGNECAAGDIGMVKVWNGVLSTAQMQTEYNAYKARFGY
jgi:hypothetical protein